jgi:hypothetical protein
MMNKCTGIGWIILSEQWSLARLSYLIGIENNLTATISIYYMDGSDLLMAHNMYNFLTKLVMYLLLKQIFSHNTNCFCVYMLC